jgi:tRNA dimethylallyltransferase
MVKPAKQKVVVLCGPTGIGKTTRAIQLATRYGGEIVSADSMQIYRDMDIGTAKPSREEQQQVAHYLIDIVDPDADFSAGQYARVAAECLAKLHDSKVIPFIVGGTGLYIKSCLHGLFREKAADAFVLARLTREADEKGPAVLHQRLKNCDPETAEIINEADTFRIVRALEVFETTGNTMTELKRSHNFAEQRYDALRICLYADRETIYNRIDQRVEKMMAQGFADEVSGLLAKGYADSLKSMQSLGYRHMIQYLTGVVSWAEMVSTMKRDTRRYAKRQLTWFRGDAENHWIDPATDTGTMGELIDRFLQ